MTRFLNSGCYCVNMYRLSTYLGPTHVPNISGKIADRLFFQLLDHLNANVSNIVTMTIYKFLWFFAFLMNSFQKCKIFICERRSMFFRDEINSINLKWFILRILFIRAYSQISKWLQSTGGYFFYFLDFLTFFIKFFQLFQALSLFLPLSLFRNLAYSTFWTFYRSENGVINCDKINLKWSNFNHNSIHFSSKIWGHLHLNKIFRWREPA